VAFVQFSKINLAFGDRDILKNVSLNLQSGSRAALAGLNGSGKSTLMKVIAGLLPGDSGERAVQKGTRVSYLPQSGLVHRGKTLREEAETAFASVHAMLHSIEEIGTELQKAQSDAGSTKGLLEEFHRLQEAVDSSGSYAREGAIAETLKGLGFNPDDLQKPCEEFSGGWQMRIALAKVLLEKPDILLLDEPTNYLDIEARNWLEWWLQSYKGGYLLVSHDRYFLDVSVNEVYELFQGQLKRYAGNYSNYEKLRAQENEALVKLYNAQQEEIEKTEKLIDKFRYKATKAAFAQELIKRLDKIERITLPESLKKIAIRFPDPPHCGKIALRLEDVHKTYRKNYSSPLGGRLGGGDAFTLHNVSLTLETGERLVVAGPNGAGKSTLLRIIGGIDTEYQGNVVYGAGVIPGYFSQDAAEMMNERISALEYLEQDAPLALIPKLRDMLGAFLFRGDDVHKSVSVLSGGEKSRLALLKMLLKPINLLILDEPTNHLDLYSKDVLLDALKAFSGAIIFVSHDRDFMEALSTKTLELQHGEPRLYYGGYDYYLERNEDSSRKDAKTQSTNVKNTSPLGVLAPLRELNKYKKQEKSLLEEIESLEQQKAQAQAELSRPEVYSVTEKARAVQALIERLEKEIHEKTLEWEKVADAIEKNK
jgi:ATP-binding cassette subfamily F protein 3